MLGENTRRNSGESRGRLGKAARLAFIPAVAGAILLPTGCAKNNDLNTVHGNFGDRNTELALDMIDHPASIFKPGVTVDLTLTPSLLPMTTEGATNVVTITYETPEGTENVASGEVVELFDQQHHKMLPVIFATNEAERVKISHDMKPDIDIAFKVKGLAGRVISTYPRSEKGKFERLGDASKEIIVVR